MTAISGRSSRHQLMAVLTFVTVLILAPHSSLSTQNARAFQADDEVLDLAAMTLTPADLDEVGFEGYGVGWGQVAFPDEVSSFYADVRDQPEAEVDEMLEEAGFRRWYESFLYSPPDEDDPESVPAFTVSSYVLEFADEDGAVAGWRFFEDESDIEMARDLRRVSDFGDESEATRQRGEDEATGDEYDELDLSFRVGRLEAGVRLTAWTGDAPTLADAEDLAAILEERIEAVLEGESPGLSNQVNRLTGNEVASWFDNYQLIDGDAIQRHQELARDTRARESFAVEVELSDTYDLWQHISPTADGSEDDVWYLLNVYQFANEEAATTWIQGAERRLETNTGFEDLDIDEDQSTFGEESIAFTIETADGSMRYRSISLRVGATVADISLYGPATPPATTVESLAEVQATCLEDGVCLEPMAVPDELAEFLADLGDESREDANEDDGNQEERRERPDLRLPTPTPDAKD